MDIKKRLLLPDYFPGLKDIELPQLNALCLVDCQNVYPEVTRPGSVYLFENGEIKEIPRIALDILLMESLALKLPPGCGSIGLCNIYDMYNLS
jgi:hypothetical protein